VANYADDKINCSLNQEDRGFLRQLASMAKENDLLDGKGRKTLFEGGKYAEWYPSRFEMIVELLTEIELSFDESTKIKINNIANKILELNVEALRLEKLYLEGEASHADKFRFAEILVNDNKNELALRVLKELERSVGLNEDINYLIGKITHNGN
jgi:hypothetical protein